MANLLILAAQPIAAIASSRGAGAVNLLTFDPKEVWQDTATGTAWMDIDLGTATPVDSIFLGAVYNPSAAASWEISGGPGSAVDFAIKAAGPLRAVDAAGALPQVSHALWTGSAVTIRYLRITITQPAGSTPLAIGRVMVGRAFVPVFNKEWGAGRGVIDTGTATRLPSGGFAVMEGARLGTYSWSLGDLSDAEVDALYALQRDVGETLPLLVVEDPEPTTGQMNRIHYGKFMGLKKYERRNARQTRWDFTIEEWV